MDIVTYECHEKEGGVSFSVDSPERVWGKWISRRKVARDKMSIQGKTNLRMEYINK